MSYPLFLASLLTAAMPAPQQRPQGVPPRDAGMPPISTIVAEPVAVAIAGFDADGDARVTLAEVQAGVARSFAAIDTAGAGSLGYIGFGDWATRYLGNANAVPSALEVDRDGDNRITAAELQRRFAEIFARLDADRDGVLVRAELLTIRGSGLGNRPEGRRGERPRPDRGEPR